MNFKTTYSVVLCEAW